MSSRPFVTLTITALGACVGATLALTGARRLQQGFAVIAGSIAFGLMIRVMMEHV